MPNAVFHIWLAFCGSLGELSGSRFDPTMEKKEEEKKKKERKHLSSCHPTKMV